MDCLYWIWNPVLVRIIMGLLAAPSVWNMSTARLGNEHMELTSSELAVGIW